MFGSFPFGRSYFGEGDASAPSDDSSSCAFQCDSTLDADDEIKRLSGGSSRYVSFIQRIVRAQETSEIEASASFKCDSSLIADASMEISQIGVFYGDSLSIGDGISQIRSINASARGKIQSKIRAAASSEVRCEASAGQESSFQADGEVFNARLIREEEEIAALINVFAEI